MRSNRRGVPFWLWGVLGGLLLIMLARGLTQQRDALSGRFAPRPGDPAVAELPLPELSVGALPEQLQRAQATAVALIGIGSSAAPLQTEVSNSNLRLEVSRLTPLEGEAGIRVEGSITNSGNVPRTIPATALLFRDGAGQVYGGGSGSATLAAGQSAPINMMVPVTPSQGLTLILNQPPDPPLELVLLAKT